MKSQVEKITINPENWVQDSVVVTINRKAHTFEINGYDFRLDDHEVMDPQDNYGFEGYRIYEGTSQHPVGTVGKLNLDTLWDACQGETISRQDADVYVASAKLVANLF